MAETRVKTQSGVRKYLQRHAWQRVRQWWVSRSLGSRGESLFLEAGVSFLRHPERVFLGSHIVIKQGAKLCPTNPSSQVTIGDWTTIGYNTCIFATVEIQIGENCLIAPNCYLVDSNHGIDRSQLIREQQMSASPIVIGPDVWLGAGVTVLKGVTIGRGAVIGAGSVVSNDIPEFAIVSGNPAVVKAFRESKKVI